MCPKNEIISAFLDGEIEAPWKEKLKEHFSACGACRQRLAEMQNLQKILKQEQEFDYLPALERVRRRIYYHTMNRESSFLGIPEKELPFWKRKVHLPMPLAVLLSIVLFILFASFFFFIGQSNVQMAKRGNEIVGPQPVQVSVDIKDLEVLQQLLRNKDFSQEVLLELPKDSQFTVFGESELSKQEIKKDR
jgi:hypothetical protein